MFFRSVPLPKQPRLFAAMREMQTTRYPRIVADNTQNKSQIIAYQPSYKKFTEQLYLRWHDLLDRLRSRNIHEISPLSDLAITSDAGETLDLKSFPLWNTYWQDIVAFIALQSKRYKILDLSGAGLGLKPGAFFYLICEAIGPNFEEINFGNNFLHEMSTTDFIKGMASLKFAKHLNLSATYFFLMPENSFSNIMRSLPHNIKRLDMRKVGLTELPTTQIISGLKSLFFLDTIDLSSNTLDKLCLADLIMLASCLTQKKVILRYTGLNRLAASDLAAFLAAISANEIDIGSNNFENFTTEELIQIFSALKAQKICLNNCRIGVGPNRKHRTAEELAAIISAFPSAVRILEIEANTIEPSEVTMLKLLEVTNRFEEIKLGKLYNIFNFVDNNSAPQQIINFLKRLHGIKKFCFRDCGLEALNAEQLVTIMPFLPIDAQEVDFYLVNRTYKGQHHLALDALCQLISLVPKNYISISLRQCFIGEYSETSSVEQVVLACPTSVKKLSLADNQIKFAINKERIIRGMVALEKKPNINEIDLRLNYFENFTAPDGTTLAVTSKDIIRFLNAIPASVTIVHLPSKFLRLMSPNEKEQVRLAFPDLFVESALYGYEVKTTWHRDKKHIKALTFNP